MMKKPNHLQQLQQSLDRQKVSYEKGIIVSIIQDKYNNIHGIIKRDSDLIQDPSHVDNSFFNDYTPDSSEKFLALMSIPITNLINTNKEPLESFVGMKVKVRLVEGIARDAIVLAEPFSSYTIHKTIRYLLNTNNQLSPIDKEFEELIEELEGVGLKDLGLVDLGEDTSKYPKVIVQKNHATSDQIIRNDNQTKENRKVLEDDIELLEGNNLLAKVKTALCHTPSKFLSGK